VHSPAALATGAAGGLAEEVAEQLVERHPLRERIAKAAMGVEQLVLEAERGDRARLEPFLPEAGMPEASKPVVVHVPLQPQLGCANARDRYVQLGREPHCVGGSRRSRHASSRR